jgi:hypothetical protein
LIVPEKEPREPALQLQTHLPQVHPAARTGPALDLKFIAEEVVELLKRLDDQEVDREPDGPPPIGVAAKKPCPRLCRLIIDPVFVSVEAFGRPSPRTRYFGTRSWVRDRGGPFRCLD